jgi:glycosyltransferase involved in cell wall biosynthesis
LAVGNHDGTAEPPCRWTIEPELAARQRLPCHLEPLLDRFQPDLIHLHNIMNPAVLEWANHHRAVVTVQDHRCFCPGPGKWRHGREVCQAPLTWTRCLNCLGDESYARRVFPLTQERLALLHHLPIIVLSEYMRSELVATGISRRQVEVIPPFVHRLDPTPPSSSEPCALFVGRLVAAKGVFDTLEAYRRSGLTFPLLFAGTGSARRHLEREGARVLGWQNRAALAELYGRARVIIMPSRWQEPFGIVGLEALSLETPVAAWTSGGVGEWHPDENLPDWGDVDALTDSIRQAVDGSVSPSPRYAAPALMARLEDVYREGSDHAFYP